MSAFNGGLVLKLLSLWERLGEGLSVRTKGFCKSRPRSGQVNLARPFKAGVGVVKRNRRVAMDETVVKGSMGLIVATRRDSIALNDPGLERPRLTSDLRYATAR